MKHIIPHPKIPQRTIILPLLRSCTFATRSCPSHAPAPSQHAPAPLHKPDVPPRIRFASHHPCNSYKHDDFYVLAPHLLLPCHFLRSCLPKTFQREQEIHHSNQASGSNHHSSNSRSHTRGGRNSKARSPSGYSRRDNANRSRSRSPVRSQPQDQTRPRSPRDRNHSFRSGDSSKPLSACLICLGRHKHQVGSCNARTLWDGKTEARCRREGNSKQILNPTGKVLCGDWQRESGCVGSNHNHECSGCGQLSHGAQKCHLADRG